MPSRSGFKIGLAAAFLAESTEGEGERETDDGTGAVYKLKELRKRRAGYVGMTERVIAKQSYMQL
jgi:hypothetical protein